MEKEYAKKRPDKDATLIEKRQEYKEDNDPVQELEQQRIEYEKSVEKRKRRKKMMMLSG